MSDLKNNLPVLYSYFRSSCAWRVRLALTFKKVDYEQRYIDLIKNEHKSEEYLKIQPFGLVPAFIDNKSGQTLIESVSILEYLDETYSDFPLLPEDPLERAKVRALVQAIAMDIQPVTNLRILRYVGDDRKDEWARHFLAEGFTALEAMLQKTAKKFAYGDSLTMADIVLVPQIFNGVRFGLDLNAYPIASRLYQELNEIPEFKATHPTKQADCPEELR